jgi:hypothetical protein
MITYARRVDTTIARGRTDAKYYDLVVLDYGPHAGQFAIIDSICPPGRPDHIREILSKSEALTRLQSWQHWEHNKSDGSSGQIWADGKKWLSQAAVH